MKVVHLMMPANKFAEAVEFYVDGLGLKSDTAEAGSIVFVVGRQKIKLVPVPGPLLQRHTNLSLHLVSTGRVPRSDLARCANAYGRFDVSDPGGNIISLVEAG